MITVCVVGAAQRACAQVGLSHDGVPFRAVLAPLEPLADALAAAAQCDLTMWAPATTTSPAEFHAWLALAAALAARPFPDGSPHPTCILHPHHAHHRPLARFELHWVTTDLAARRLAATTRRLACLERAFHELLLALERSACHSHTPPSPPNPEQPGPNTTG
jgi:hypothetical protein